ncbi:hypothetical protein J1614_011260 [Plenodomus biglobosus]|nr:hypothetical protein J1614_011260 [Plenodomus biglobosus]
MLVAESWCMTKPAWARSLQVKLVPATCPTRPCTSTPTPTRIFSIIVAARQTTFTAIATVARALGRLFATVGAPFPSAHPPAADAPT